MPRQHENYADRMHPGIALPEGTRVYAVGDVHGRLDLLLALHDLIREDLAANPPQTALLVYLGDYVDRGPHSAGVIETLLSDPVSGVETVHLMGNHEQVMLDFAIDGTFRDTWFRNGGRETLQSYGVDPDGAGTGDEAVAALARAFADALPKVHRHFLAAMPTSHRAGSLFFAHAGIDPARPLDAQQDHDLMWIRDAFLHDDRDTGAVVVHGHTPAPEPEVTPHRINVDTGAWCTGRLTAAVLENGRVRFLDTAPDGT